MTAEGLPIPALRRGGGALTPPGSPPGVLGARPLARQARRRAQVGLRPALIRQLVLLLTVAVLAAPAATPMAGWVRWSFPALSVLVAGWLVLRDRSGPYVTFCLWLFVLTPLVRRIVDVHVGYSHANVLMLAPYLGGTWAALAAPRFFLARGRPGQGPMALLFATILYGFVLALVADRLFAGTLDLLKWSMPPLLACYIIVKAEDWEAICTEIRAWTILALPLISVYGLYQFVAPPDWDVNWMLNSGMKSIGQPRPFEIRVFSTMNSPASFAYYLEALILLTVSLKLRLRWLSVAVGIAALVVSLVRSAWLGLAIGLSLLLVRAPLKVRVSVLTLAVASVTLAPLALTNARVEKIVSARIETLSNVDQDRSFSQRVRSYGAFARELDQHPWGYGFGIANVSASYTESVRVIDGGPIEILLSLGLLFGPLYLAAVACFLISAIMCRPPRAEGDVFVAAVTIAAVQAMALSSVTTVVGELGVLFWLAVGLVLASPTARQRYAGQGAKLSEEVSNPLT